MAYFVCCLPDIHLPLELLLIPRFTVVRRASRRKLVEVTEDVSDGGLIFFDFDAVRVRLLIVTIR